MMGRAEPVMADLLKEREHLAKAELDITDGEKRMTEQIIRIQRLRDGGRNTAQAEEMLRTLEETLKAWREHRQTILDTIARLEGDQDRR